MEFFEKELRKMVGNTGAISDIKYFGNVCYAKLTETTRVRMELISQSVAGHYTSLKATIINRHDGPVDSVILPFSDLLGKRTVSNPNFPDGIYPYIWIYGGKAEWYVYKPTVAEYEQITEVIKNYLDMFRDPALAMDQPAHTIKDQSI